MTFFLQVVLDNAGLNRAVSRHQQSSSTVQTTSKARHWAETNLLVSFMSND
jgi:hypothetical protein